MEGLSETALSLRTSQKIPKQGSASRRSFRGFCARCKSINFENISNWSVPDAIGLSVTNLNATAEELRAADCRLCQLLGSVAPRDTEDQKRICHLRAFSIRAIFGLQDMTDQGVIPYIAIFGVVPFRIGAIQKNERDTMRRSLLETGFLTLTKDSGESDRSHFRIINRDSFDTEFAKFCIAYCQSKHGTQCTSKDFASMIDLRVIDCRTRAIINAPNECEYVALSYVWGATASDPVPQDANVLPALENLPKVINDSIDVTLNIGFQYLWIDKYCIDQYNDKVRHEQICQMDLIYSNAEVTIVAVAGQDASYGLPGINGIKRNYQPHIKYGRHLLASTLAHPKASIERSKWATRGWTFQEGVLSKRRLFFTNDQVIFDCNTVHCAEIMSQPSKVMHPDAEMYNPKRSAELENPISPFVHKYTTDPRNIMSFIAEFSQRSLSFPEDRLNAMQEIFQSFFKNDWPLWHIEGIPIFPAVNPYLWEASWPKPEQAFIAGLAWKSIIPGRRNRALPSWTWAGWTNTIGEHPGQSSSCEECPIPDTKRPNILYPRIWLEDRNGILVRFPADFGSFRVFHDNHQESIKFFHIESITFTCVLAIDSKISRMHLREDRQMIHFPSDTLFLQIPVQHPWLSVIFVHFHPDESKILNQGQRKTSEYSEDKELTGVLLNNCHEDLHAYEGKIIVLEEHDNHFQRIGVAFLSEAFVPLYSDSSGRDAQRLDHSQIATIISSFQQVQKLRVG